MSPTATIAQVAFIGLSAAAVYGFVQAAKNDQLRTTCTATCALRPAYANDDRKVPDFELADMNGNKVRLADFKGKTIILNFWTKTCKPCLEEMPSLAEMAKVFKNRSDIVMLTVSIDAGPDDVRDTLQVALGEEPPFTILFDPESSVVGDKFGTKLFPETWIIDKTGVIRARFDGPRDWSEALAIEIVERVASGGCPVEFDRGVPTGPNAGVCNDDS